MGSLFLAGGGLLAAVPFVTSVVAGVIEASREGGSSDGLPPVVPLGGNAFGGGPPEGAPLAVAIAGAGPLGGGPLGGG